MAAFLKAVASLVSVLSFISDLVSRWLKARDVKEAAEAAINKEEAENARTASAILAERRDPDDAIKRLRDGTF
jgi:hypothetical protein